MAGLAREPTEGSGLASSVRTFQTRRKSNLMLKRPREEEREQRIQWEIVPDAHDAEEQAAGWWAYLEDTFALSIPDAVPRRASQFTASPQ
jgi:hypothetical protein